MDMGATISKLFSPVVSFLVGIFLSLFWICFIFAFLFFVIFLLRYPFYIKRFKCWYLMNLQIKFKPYDFMRWSIYDFLTRSRRKKDFRLFGFTIFVGRQGSGKTISLIQYLEVQRKKYPECLIVTNFKYKYATHRMKDWRDLMEIRNGTKGVIFAIDEIHSEYSSAAWKDFPENLLSEISQQRKQRIKIIATSQVFSRVVKPIREQVFSVVCCETYFGRYTRNLEYDASEFSTSDSPYQVKKTVKPFIRTSFIQSNALRRTYDTYEKIERMKKLEFIPRAERH